MNASRRSTSRTPRHLTALALAACLPLLGGCFLLSSNDSSRDAIELRIRAQADTSEIRRGDPCPDPVDLLDDVASLTGRAVVFCSPPGESATRRAGTADMSVTRVSGTAGTLELNGDMEIDVGPAGSSYFVRVTLFYQGREIAGSYEGDVLLESGIAITIGSLDLATTSSQGGVETLASTICVQSDAVDNGVPFCHSGDDPDAPVDATYDRSANALVLRYQTTDEVDWDGEIRDGIVVELRAGLLPTPIFEGEGEIPFLVPGGNDPIDVPVILLTPVDTPPRHPLDIGERVEGVFKVRFTDGLPPTESGRVTLTRRVRACN